MVQGKITEVTELRWTGVDYLSDRTQTFQAGPQLSGPHNVQCSVPQRSVLGPKKFTAYTEDLAVDTPTVQLGATPSN